MIQEIITHRCRCCDSVNIVKNGHNAQGRQQYWCKDCNKRAVLHLCPRWSEEKKEEIIGAYHERPSMRGISRMFGVSRQTLASWLKKDAANPVLEETLLPAQNDDVLELDEMWSFVLKKVNRCWLWTAICRRTRQVVAFVLGDRSESACRLLWERIPMAYKTCRTFSDFWSAYCKVFPKETHSSVGKETGQTCRVERWNNTCRQSNARYTRKTLSFSKTAYFHELATRLFIVRYNLKLRASLSI
ncbi:MAG: IS1 family transposase [Candidatus Electronema sp. VV]